MRRKRVAKNVRLVNIFELAPPAPCAPVRIGAGLFMSGEFGLGTVRKGEDLKCSSVT